MLQRRVSQSGIVFYASPLLEAIGVRHAFSTRIGGVGAAPFDSMNLGNPNGCDVQDSTANIQENYRLLQAVIYCENAQSCYVHQVHGNIAANACDASFNNSIKADALISDDPLRMVSVRIADCVPILLASDDGRVVAAVHAGWRGVIANVVESAIRIISTVHTNITPSRLIAAIGPCIGFEAFEVGPEVIAEFDRVFGDDAPVQRFSNGKGHVDLRAALRLQLLRLGVAPDRIDGSDRCTFRDADEFFSHRRDKGITGRMAALIAPKEKFSHSHRPML